MKSTANRLTIVIALVFAIGSVTPVFADYAAGMAAYKAKDYATAAAEFEAVIEAQPDQPATHYMLGLCRRAQRDISGALASFRKAVELDSAAESPNPMYPITLGQTLVQAKQYNEAYTTLNALSLASLPANYKTTYALLFANAANETNRSGEAVNVLNAQIRADSSNAALYQALGVAQDNLGYDKDAYAAFKRAFDLNKDEKIGRYAVHSATEAAKRGSPSEKTRYYTEAAQTAEAMAAAKGSFDNNLLVGESWMGAKQYSKALTWFNKAAGQKSQNAIVRFYIGQCYSKLEQYDNALSALQQALKLGSNNADLRKKIYNQMGYVYEAKRDFGKAKQAYLDGGFSSKATAMNAKIEAQAGNLEHEKQCREFKLKIDALSMQAEEFEKLGDMESAKQIREQAVVLQREYTKTCG
ncbi:MAG: CDC27 family protein [Thermoanaerobaculales bacterium]|jgi:tetratricopeptide (TPR) repeat protein|nr:CDC27 family protein [Thermoanaerobaculales bacterium]